MALPQVVAAVSPSSTYLTFTHILKLSTYLEFQAKENIKPQEIVLELYAVKHNLWKNTAASPESILMKDVHSQFNILFYSLNKQLAVRNKISYQFNKGFRFHERKSETFPYPGKFGKYIRRLC
jgi:hypothetical protein